MDLAELIIKTVILITIQKRFLVKQIVLIFSLIRIAFFVKHIKFENRKAPKNTISEEYQKRGILKDGGIFACQKIRKKKLLLRGCKSVHR